MFEIQFHPADIRKPVRYHFLTRVGARWIVGAAIALALVTISGLVLSPLGIQGLLLTSRLNRLNQLNTIHREVLDHRTEALGRLERRMAASRARQRQISLILGTPEYEPPPAVEEPASSRDEILVPAARDAALRAMTLENQSIDLLSAADDLIGFSREHQELVRIVPSICPIGAGEFVLTSPFGERISPFTSNRDFHAGLDLAARAGTPVMATGDARVIFAGRFPLSRNARWWRYGNAVVLKHGQNFLTIYAHLDEILVKRGQHVTRGQTIGTVGNSGWSTSPHLHYEVRAIPDDGSEPVPVDPRIHILDHQWQGHEAMLIAGRWAPRPDFDPLPSRIR